MTQTLQSIDAVREEEQAHLEKTRELILWKRRRLEAEGERQRGALDIDNPNQRGVNPQTLRRLFEGADALFAMEQAWESAFFAHMQLKSENGDVRDVYLGRFDVQDAQSGEHPVMDWRSETGDVFYACDQEDAETMTASAEKVTMRRVFRLQGGHILEAEEEAENEENADGLLREITPDLLPWQNRVIRRPLAGHLLLSGPSGCGKTSLILHRTAYLLYRHPELQQDHVLILLSSPLQLAYTAKVLPALGVRRVRRETMESFVRSLMGRSLPKLVETESAKCDGDETARRIHACKASLRMWDELEAFLQSEPERMVPREDLTFGGFVLVTQGEMRDLILHQYASLPLARRIQEARKPVERKLHGLTDRMKKMLEDMTQDKLNRLLASMPDGPERRMRAGRLLDMREARKKEVDDHAQTFMDDFEKQFPDCSLLSVYRRFLASQKDRELQTWTEDILDRGRVEKEDIPVLLRISQAVQGIELPELELLVADDCQTLSPFSLRLFRTLYPSAAWTLSGEMTMEGDEAAIWKKELFPDGLDLVNGQGFDRCSRAIRATIDRASVDADDRNARPDTGDVPEGEMPELKRIKTEKEQLTILTQTIQAWQDAGLKTIGILCPNQATARRLAGKMDGVRLVTERDTHYEGGVCTLAGIESRGLAFDGVILTDVSKSAFPEDTEHASLLRTMMSRARRRLLLLSKGNVTTCLSFMINL